MSKIETANYPWVFWINISYRPQWFKKFWKTRGANYVEYQVWVFKISIGQPWFKGALDAHQRDYGSAKHIHKTNQDILHNTKLSILIKPKTKPTTP